MTDIGIYLDVANAYGPALSPDGSKLAYLIDKTGILQIWLATSPSGEAFDSIPTYVFI